MKTKKRNTAKRPVMRQKCVAYCRVSTARQGKAGLSITAQTDCINEMINHRDWQLVGNFVEQESGKNPLRPELNRAIQMAKKEKAVLIVARLDRLARNAGFVNTLIDGGVHVVFCDLPELDTTQAGGKMMLTVLAGIAEYEARLVSERTTKALAVAKKTIKRTGSYQTKGDASKGIPSRKITRLGAPNAGETIHAARKKRLENVDAYAESLRPIVKELREKAHLTNLQDLADALNARGVKTIRAASSKKPLASAPQWYASSVSNLLKRLKK